MKKISILIVVQFQSIILSGFYFFAACDSNCSVKTNSKISIMMNKTISQNGLTGLTVAVFTGDSVYALITQGLRRINSNDSLTIEDRFHLGSNGKAILSFAAASLVEKGLINWNTKFFDLFPELIEFSKKEYFDATLKELLTHRAGLVSKEIETKEIFLPNFNTDTRIDRMDLFKWALSKAKYYGGFQYSNVGYVMAVSMLEKVTTKNWQNLLIETVFQPLDIEASFGWPANSGANQPWGHWPDPKTRRLIAHSPHANYHLAKLGLERAGDINMSIIDYVKFLQDNLKGMKGQGGILSRSSYKMIHSGNKYGLGWMLLDNYDSYQHVSFHSGSGGTFYCLAFILRDNDIGIALTTNCVIEKLDEILIDLALRILKLFPIS